MTITTHCKSGDAIKLTKFGTQWACKTSLPGSVFLAWQTPKGNVAFSISREPTPALLAAVDPDSELRFVADIECLIAAVARL